MRVAVAIAQRQIGTTQRSELLLNGGDRPRVAVRHEKWRPPSLGSRLTLAGSNLKYGQRKDRVGNLRGLSCDG